MGVGLFPTDQVIICSGVWGGGGVASAVSCHLSLFSLVQFADPPRFPFTDFLTMGVHCTGKWGTTSSTLHAPKTKNTKNVNVNS